MELDLFTCSRCGAEHLKVKFKELSKPIFGYNLFALCPELKEPVFAKRYFELEPAETTQKKEEE